MPKKRMTLSEHLALRAQTRKESKERDEQRPYSIQALRELDALATCNCPACVRARQPKSSPADREMHPRNS